MPLEAVSLWPPAGVSIAVKTIAPGASMLAPTSHHRIVIHTSPATRSVCRETGKEFVRRDGDIDLIPSEEAGGFDAQSEYQSLEICLAPGVLERVATEMNLPVGAARLEPKHMLRDSQIYHLARALENDTLAKLPAGSLFTDSIGVALASRLLALGANTARLSARLSNAQIKRILDYIDAHLDSSLTIDVLSRIAGSSSSHLRTWFKVVTGTSLHRFVLRRRVEQARNLLVHSDMTLSEVAMAVGFAHQSHLARWIRRELGVRPSDLRRSRAAN